MPYHIVSNEQKNIDERTEVLLVSGIANPKPLKKFLGDHSLAYYEILYNDHHIFTIDDWKEIRKRFDSIPSQNKIILTTEKDAVRLVKFRQSLTDYPFYVIPIKVNFLFNEESRFTEFITKFIDGFSNKNRKFNAKRKNQPISQKNRTGRRPQDIQEYWILPVRGWAFVIIQGVSQDIMVRPSDFNTALHGDTVRVITKGDFKRGRQQGEVVEVLKRKQLEFPGKLQLSENFAFFIPDVDKPMPDIFVPLDKIKNATERDTVVVKIVEWQKNKKPVGEVVQVMDESDESDFAMKQILMENGFPLNFPEEVIEESERIPEIISAKEISSRKDMRNVFTITIDPIDAKDFDDAVSLRKLDNGNYEIGVHIADVSHFIEPGSALDTEAYERATSVYLPDRVLPMLPERISNGLCSLRPNEDKLTFSSIFEISPKGDIKSRWLGRTVIHSNHRFSYEEVQEIIENEGGYTLKKYCS